MLIDYGDADVMNSQVWAESTFNTHLAIGGTAHRADEEAYIYEKCTDQPVYRLQELGIKRDRTGFCDARGCWSITY